jgi:cytochrome c-type biogenesis protein CcmH/NrfG
MLKPLLPPSPRGFAAALLVVIALVQGGCAARAPAPPSPSELRSLEARVQRSPGDAEAVARLGAGYRAAGRFAEAMEALEPALVAAPDHPGLLLQLALTYEDEERLA